MKQISRVEEPIKIRIDYGGDLFRDVILINKDELSNDLELMFGPYMGPAIFKILNERKKCTFPVGEIDKFYERKRVYEITADFNYEFPESKPEETKQPEEDKSNELPATEETGQERTETESVQVSGRGVLSRRRRRNS